MSPSKSWHAFVLSAFFGLPAAHADDRALIIQKQMNCVDAHLPQAGLSWNDVCDMPASSQQFSAASQQMDEMQTNTPNEIPDIAVKVPASKPQEKEMTFDMAPEISFIKFKEGSYIKESGDMYGLQANVTFHPPMGETLNSPLMDVYRVEGLYSAGEVNYNGNNLIYIDQSIPAILLNIPGSHDGIMDYMAEIRGLGGKDFYLNNSTLVRPYLGIGYRYLFDRLHEDKPLGYDRRTQYFYAPVGIEAKTALFNGWSLGADLEYDIFIRGFVTDYFRQVGFGDLTAIQQSGYGIRASLKLAREFNRFNLFLEPFFRYWNVRTSRFDASNPYNIGGTDYFYNFDEPAGTSLEVGTKLGVEF